MSVPISVSDGNFAVAEQNGSWQYSYPFADKGDFISFKARRRMRQNAAHFTPPIPMTTRTFAGQYSVTYPTAEISSGAVLVSGSTTKTTPALAYLVSISDPSRVDDRSGLLEWEETWANVPVKRLEPTSTTYTQLIAIDGTTPLQYSGTFNAYEIYEYAVQPQTGMDVFQFVALRGTSTAYPLPVPALPVLRAPRVTDLGDGTLRIIGNFSQSQLEMQGVPILAQDSENSIYAGGIICRKSVWVIKAIVATL